MLTNFHLLDLLSQTSPISGTYKEMNMQFRKFSHKGNCKFEKYKCVFLLLSLNKRGRKNLNISNCNIPHR
jgi:hypothetical protein